jgi:hypothetical protein
MLKDQIEQGVLRVERGVVKEGYSVLKHLCSTTLAVLLSLVIALVVSCILNRFLNPEAFAYVWAGSGSIETPRLVQYAAFRDGCLLLGAIFGFIVAQVTYILDRLQKQQPS